MKIAVYGVGTGDGVVRHSAGNLVNPIQQHRRRPVLAAQRLVQAVSRSIPVQVQVSDRAAGLGQNAALAPVQLEKGPYQAFADLLHRLSSTSCWSTAVVPPQSMTAR